MSHISWQNVGDVIASHQNFSHATWYCRNLQEGINCLGTEPKLKSNESCGAIFELGHCWHETPHGEFLNTTCPDPTSLMHSIEPAQSNKTTQRYCFPREVTNGTTLDAEWMDVWRFYETFHKRDCAGLDELYQSYDISEDYADISMADFGDYSSSQYDLPNVNGALPGDESALSSNLQVHIILSILSFFTTLVSLLLMMFFLRKCTRIYIHMNLLCAFMLRSLIFLWGQVVLGVWHEPKYQYINKLIDSLTQYMHNLFQVDNLSQMEAHYDEYCVVHFENERRFIFLCRLYPSVQHYIVLVCFSWLSCEGLYLIMLQQRPTWVRNINPLRWFVALSWLFPVLIVSTWAAAMLNRPGGEHSCFETHKYLIWIVEAPIHFYILGCFAIFIVLLRDIIRKLRAPDYIGGRGNFSWRMSKATLSLIPLLGIQYLLVPYMTEEYGIPGHIVRIIEPFTISITASHGIVVSFLYCFTSSEMKEAMIRRWRVHRELQGFYNEISRRESRDSNSHSFPFQHFLNRIAGRRSSLLSRRNDTNSLQNDSRNDQVLLDPLQLKFIAVGGGGDNPQGKRHSACSKHSDMSLESNGYHSGKSEHDGHLDQTSLPVSEDEALIVNTTEKM